RCVGVFSALPALLTSASDGRNTALVHDGVLILAVRAEGRLTALRRIPFDSPSASAALAEHGYTESDAARLSDMNVAASAAAAVAMDGTREFLPPPLRAARTRRARLRGAVMTA